MDNHEVVSLPYNGGGVVVFIYQGAIKFDDQ